MRLKSLAVVGAQLLGLTLITTGCASFPVSSVINAIPSLTSSEETAVDETADDELTELVTTMRQDLTAHRMRERERLAVLKPTPVAVPKANYGYVNVTPAPAPSIDSFATRHGFSEMPSLLLPVVGIEARQLRDNWGEPRDGGRRRHRGIDIFAPRGRELVAVADGYISFIGEQPKGGKVVWLSTTSGYSFYYAHLDRWAPGLYEGMQVRAGDLLGYVGTTGNAKRTSPHLHFSVHDPMEQSVNPYPLLKFSQFVSSATPTHLVGYSRGTN